MGLARTDIDEAWVADLCRSSRKELRSFSLAELGGAQGVISRYERSTHEALIGHHLLTIRFVASGVEREQSLVIKSKAPGAMIRCRLEEVYRRFDPRLAELQHALAPSILDDCHRREPAIYALENAALRSITPAIERVWIDEAKQIFVIVMELLEGVRHENTLDDLDAWSPQDIELVLSQIASVHAEFLGKPPPWLLPFPRLNNDRLLAYQQALLRYNRDTFPELFDQERTSTIESFLDETPERHRRIIERPLTLIHGDLTPRNLCLRAHGQLCAYDWELAQIHLPERDICEFLCYVLNPDDGWRSARELLERYRRRLECAAGRAISYKDFQHDLAAALQEFCTFKLLVQGITHQLLGKRHYFERLVENAFEGIKEVGR